MDGFLPTFIRRTQTPPTFGEFTRDRPSSKMGIPERVVVPLQDTHDTPCDIMVQEGESVRLGQKIGLMGKPPVSVCAHASTSGKVDRVGLLPHPLGFLAQSVSILSDGKDDLDDLTPLNPKKIGDDKSRLFEAFREMGIPLNYELLYGRGFKVSSLLVNATEFEPYITSKHHMIKERGQDLVGGLRVLIGACSASQAVIVVEKRQSSLVNILRSATKEVPEITIKTVLRPYPETAANLLAQKLSLAKSNHSKSVHAGDPMSVDLSSLLAINNACFLGVPFVEQLVTVAGSGIKDPQNVWVKTGVPLLHIINHAGGSPSRLGRVTLGGPLMGIPQQSLEVPLIKRAKGLFAATAFLFDEHRESRFYKRTPCIKCAKCVDACPASIIPNAIADYVDNELLGDAEQWGIFRCVECGLCEYVCPSRIPLLEIMRLGKVLLKGEESLLARINLKTLGW
ncbi:MAG: RnfABCDGE type electron transport complex subunit C [Deltaproteobacteria bacterium]|nr:RnfABCDGE type electron transport complex subunit C [Deltaproteobacteria bacterium]